MKTAWASARWRAPSRRRAVLALGLAWSTAAVPAGAAERRVEAWVVLAASGTAALQAHSPAQRQEHRRSIDQQQAALLQQLSALGAVERGRQTLTRSALLVEVDEALFDRIRQLPGVLRVQKVTHRHSTGPVPSR